MAFTWSACLFIAFTVFVSHLQASPLALNVRAIDPGLFDKLNLFEQFSAAAYCPSNNDNPAGGFKLTCSSGSCPLVEAADVTTVYEFQNSKITDVTGYIAVDRTRDLTVIAFRGSQSVRNFVADATTAKVPTDLCAGCTAHQGFWASWVEARTGIMAALMATAKTYPSSKVVVVGHSLGGAIANFAAAEIRNKGVNADLYTYGAPRIAGKTLSDYITNQNKGGNFRVTHGADPVPRLPPLLLGFVHISPEYWITAPTNVVPTPADITRFDGSINLRGNSGQTRFDTEAHGWYFGDVSSCYPEDLTEFRKRDLME